MKILLILYVIFLSSCIGPIKELERQIEDVYFNSSLDETPNPLPQNIENQINIETSWALSDLNLSNEPNLLFKENTIFLVQKNGNFLKIDSITGKKIFEKKLDIEVSLGLFGNKKDEFLFFIDKSNYLNKIDSSGVFLWRIKLKKTVLVHPAFYKDQILIKYKNNDIESFDINNGNSTWSYNRQNPPLSINLQSPFIIADDLIYTGYPGGKVIILDAINGTFLTELSLARGSGVTDIERANDVSGRITIIGSNLIAASYNGEIVSFDRRSGKKNWNRKISSYFGTFSDTVNLFLIHQNDSIYNFDFKTGKTLWKFDDLLNRKLSEIVIIGDNLFVVDYLGIIYSIDINEGIFSAMKSLDDSVDGLLDFGDTDHVINGINRTKLYKYEDSLFVLFNNSKLFKLSINE